MLMHAANERLNGGLASTTVRAHMARILLAQEAVDTHGTDTADYVSRSAIPSCDDRSRVQLPGIRKSIKHSHSLCLSCFLFPQQPEINTRRR